MLHTTKANNTTDKIASAHADFIVSIFTNFYGGLVGTITPSNSNVCCKTNRKTSVNMLMVLPPANQT
jgi:hypothetical protein